MKFKKIFQKAAAVVMAAVTVFSVLPATTAFAAVGDVGTISFSHTYDGNGNAMRYNSSANINGYIAGGTGNYKYRMFVDGDTAFCLQPGVPLKTGNTLKEASSEAWNALSRSQKKAVGLALLYGYQGNRGNLSGSDDEKWLATQTLVWEFVTGCREATGSYRQTSSTVYSLHFGSHYPNSGAKKVYDQIVSLMSKHNTIPSFMSGGKDDITKELVYKDGKYSLTLTDKNGVLSEYSFASSSDAVSVAKSGNKLTLTSKKAFHGSVRITATRNGVPVVSQSAKLIAYGDPNLQDVITGVENASPVSAYLNVETPTGTIALKKTSEDGVVAGIQFTIKGEGINKTVTTDENGNITVEGLFPATYTITEQTIDRYEPQQTQTVTLIGGKTTTVNFNNTLKRGSLEVVKTSEDNLVEGVKFHLYGTSLSGLAVDEYAVTDGKGVAKFEDVLISGDTPYVLEEVDTAIRYVVPASQTAPIEWNKVTNRSFQNILKKFNVTVTKTDAETGTPQGDASLAGAVYGIYKGEELIDTYTTDENGQFTTRKMSCLYDTFTGKYGLINNRGNYLAFASDESYFLLCSLEVLDDDGKFKRKADMFTKRTIKPHRTATSVETASEALALSIGEKACVDLGYMEQLTGKTQEELIADLQGVIFRVPNAEPARYVTADEYLSGNVREKLTVAEIAAKQDPSLSVNVEALKQVIPKDLPASEIAVRLGTTWIPQEDIQQFVMELLTPSQHARGRIKVRYTPYNGDWFIENKTSDYGNVKADSTYGTKRASAYRIIEDTLNLKDTRIFDYVYDEHGNKKAVFNHKETTAAQAKQEVIKQAFQDWIWKDPERRNRLVRYYNDTFNSIRTREYDGSHITFGGISPEIQLRPHQVNAIAHILYGGNTLLAHKVGAGKTFEMVAAAQESKRLGLCNKSMFVVPNHLVGQWASEYLRLYPSANILVTTKQDFETANRKKFCSRIATGDYDAVIIGHSQFEKIQMSVERQYEQLQKQLDDIERGIEDVQKSNGEQFTVKQLMKTRKAIEQKLKKLNDTKRKDNVIDFEQLGVDRLFIDESHFYKNLYLYTKMRNVGGIAQTEAQKSSDLFMKCRYLDEITGNRGTIFATGTPISNSMVEMYSVQRYLQYDTLVRNGLQHFDSWASTFGETITALELAPEGTNYRAKTRFAKFYNLPELMLMFREVADIQTADMLKLPVPKVNYHNIKTKPSEIQIEMVASLAKRAEKIRARLVEPQVDNMLKVTNDGRKLALDQRMIDPMLPDDPESKVNTCIDNVHRIWEEHADTKAAQLIFCDLSTPKNDGSFNVYDDIREKLIRRGVPAEQIRFIHEATTDVQKKELFAKVRSGEVRILLGSTQKMGAGTNVQDRLVALHNLDCPWRPSDVGRILRTFKIKKNVEVTYNGKIII